MNKQHPVKLVRNLTGEVTGKDPRFRDLIFDTFFFNDTAPTEIYTTYDTLSLHDALPISPRPAVLSQRPSWWPSEVRVSTVRRRPDRKSTRLNSSHRRLSRMPSSAGKKKNEKLGAASAWVVLGETDPDKKLLDK